MPQVADARCLAAVTHRFPGPTMMSHGRTPTPRARAATACAPPQLSTASAPATAAAASMTGSRLGVAAMTVPTPATRAGMTVMSTDDGSGWRPPGA